MQSDSTFQPCSRPIPPPVTIHDSEDEIPFVVYANSEPVTTLLLTNSVFENHVLSVLEETLKRDQGENYSGDSGDEESLASCHEIWAVALASLLNQHRDRPWVKPNYLPHLQQICEQKLRTLENAKKWSSINNSKVEKEILWLKWACLLERRFLVYIEDGNGGGQMYHVSHVDTSLPAHEHGTVRVSLDIPLATPSDINFKNSLELPWKRIAPSTARFSKMYTPPPSLASSSTSSATEIEDASDKEVPDKDLDYITVQLSADMR
ncbi:hypothetical protein AJ80_09848 [Polytolypa hystricis UAMH7299]|uniref:Uncharacterized protein n=1 Tax=Polytolypa hystricis (strain UAMH7299) TaxID=1447883 RepID=A0A2B7WII1_POLH7|nr:hypothetical protein AJ80_09848 [Polytolypa hystricis UAMH7299]